MTYERLLELLYTHHLRRDDESLRMQVGREIDFDFRLNLKLTPYIGHVGHFNFGSSWAGSIQFLTHGLNNLFDSSNEWVLTIKLLTKSELICILISINSNKTYPNY